MTKKFFRCSVCGNLVGLVHEGGGQLVCCNQPMNELTANTSDGAQEKHVPVYKLEGDMLSVEVGSVPHPMTKEHWIQWIMVTQGERTQRTELTPDEAPRAVFQINPTEAFTVYEYCNLHGLWMTSSNKD